MTMRALMGLVLTACLVTGQTPSAEARLEAAIHSETVVGDVKGALDQYQKLLAQSGNNRPVAARALLGVAQCQEKLGLSAQARATYAAVGQQYSDQTEIAAQARSKVTALAGPVGEPLNLGFQNGIRSPSESAWFVPRSLQDAGYSAEVRHVGCRESSSCAVVTAVAGTQAGLFGTVMQTFSAAAYRGKTVRLRSFLKSEAVDPSDSAQMWLRVDLPNHVAAGFDNMDDRPVRSANWTAAEIVVKVASDAEFINIGLTSVGKGKAWVDGLTFEVIPSDSAETGAQAMSQAAPRNLDFLTGVAGEVPKGWFAIRGEGFSAELKHDGCRGVNPCAVVIGSATPGRFKFGNLMQSFSASAYRGKTVRLRAWLKMDGVEPNDAAQMWFRVDNADHKHGAFDNMDNRPVKTAEWKFAEIVGKVTADAELINFGVISIGKGRAWVDGITFDVVPDSTPVTSSAPVLPFNLDFANGTPGAPPTGWFGVRTNGYSFEMRRTGCAVGPACGVVTGSATPQQQKFGSMAQAINATAYRGKTVRFRAKVKLDAVDAEDKAQLWFREDLPNRKTGFFDNMQDRPVQSAEWKDYEIVAKIDPAAEMLTFGVLTTGKGQAWIDAISFEVVADGTPETGMGRQR